MLGLKVEPELLQDGTRRNDGSEHHSVQAAAGPESLSEELAYVRQESGRTTESEGFGLYRPRSREGVGLRMGSEASGEGRESRGVRALTVRD